MQIDDIRESVHLRDYLVVLLKRRNSALTFFTVLVIIVTIGTLTTTPLYRASTRVLIDKENQNITNLKDVYYEPFYAEDYYRTQHELIKSTSVAFRVVKNLNLKDNPAFNTELQKTTKGDMKNLPQPTSSEGPFMNLVKHIQAGLTVEPVKNSRIVNISYEHQDPKLAAAIADGIANAYIEQVLDIKMGTAKHAVEWMSRKIEEQKIKLDESQRALQEYMKDKDIVALENKESVTPQKLLNLSYQLTLTETKRREAEALYNQVKDLTHNIEGALTVPAIAGDPVIQSLRSEEIKKEKEIMEMSKKYGEKHPQMIRFNEDFRAIKEKISSEVRRVIAAIKNDYELSKSKEASLRNQFAQGRGEALTLSEKSIQYGVLKREVEGNQQIYEALLKRIKETSLIEEVKSFNIYIVDKAEVPKNPVRPRKVFNIFLSIIVGIFGGIGVAFFLEYIDNTFKRPEDIEERLSIPLLGVIPLISKTDAQDLKFETFTHENPKSNISEAYRTLRTSILLSAVDPIKSLIITSSIEAEGKTTTAVNLAIALAQMDKMVLLVDADLRKPKIHSVFGVDNEIGLSTFLTRQLMREIIKETLIPNLSIISSGPIPPNPSELLSSKRMQEFIQIVNEKFDIVVFDTAPIVTVTDTSILSGLVDGTIFVIKSGKTTFDIAKRSIKILRDINSKIFGGVLNGMDISKEGYNYMYPYYYQYGQYGSPKKEKEKSFLEGLKERFSSRG